MENAPRESINLADRDLFGNEAAEDEEADVFESYALRREEVEAFADPTRRFCVARAYKGEGKSALLRLTELAVRSTESPPLTVAGPVTAFAPTMEDGDFDTWVRAWKATLLDRLAHRIGQTIDHAWSDDAMALVEHAEKQGFRSRGLVSSVLDRLGAKVKVGPAEFAVGKPGATNPEQAVARWAEGREPIWIVVDDVDQNFENTARYRTRVASFFVACRHICNEIPELRVRAAVRPNVWTTVKMQFEPLSHVEQYVTDLAWTEADIRRLLARRVEGYLRRRARWKEFSMALPTDTKSRDRQLIGLVFEDPMHWGNSDRPPYVVLHTLSKHRPRWLIELCSLAAQKTATTQRTRVTHDDVIAQLEGFGRRRMQDTVAEFRSQCPEIEELFSALHGIAEELTTDKLVRTIENKVLNHLTPHIVGIPGEPKALDVAAFLFEIGVIFARRDHNDGSYTHIAYADRPSLLRSRANVDEGLRWEVHPVFRQALEIRDATGREIPKNRRRRIVR